MVEADESDRSLLKLSAEVAVLTNAELDHHSTYASRLDLEATFAEFLARAPVRIAWARPGLLALAGPGRDPLRRRRTRRRAGGVALRMARARGAPHGARRPQRGQRGGRARGGLRGPAPRPRRPRRRSTSFRGAARRFEPLGATPAGAQRLDDYAHHPTEVAATLAAARTLAPPRVIAVFQPHLYSRTARPAPRVRRRAGRSPTWSSCSTSTRPASGRRTSPGVTGRLVAAAAADAAGGRPVAWLPGSPSAAGLPAGVLRARDLCLVIGAGDVDALGRALVAG